MFVIKKQRILQQQKIMDLINRFVNQNTIL